jgi:hypothetical protein
MLNLKLVLLNSSHGHPGTELFNPLLPLVREELFVHHDHSSDTHFACYFDGANRFAKSTRQRKHSTATFFHRFQNLLNCLWLIDVLAKFSTERDFVRDRIRTLVPRIRFDVLLSVMLWNAQVVLVAPKDFERNPTRVRSPY